MAAHGQVVVCLGRGHAAAKRSGTAQVGATKGMMEIIQTPMYSVPTVQMSYQGSHVASFF